MRHGGGPAGSAPRATPRRQNTPHVLRKPAGSATGHDMIVRSRRCLIARGGAAYNCRLRPLTGQQARGRTPSTGRVSGAVRDDCSVNTTAGRKCACAEPNVSPRACRDSPQGLLPALQRDRRSCQCRRRCLSRLRLRRLAASQRRSRNVRPATSGRGLDPNRQLCAAGPADRATAGV